MSEQHECFWCKYKSLKHHCRSAGILDLDKLAATYLSEVCRPSDRPVEDRNDYWSYECVNTLVSEDPDRAWTFVLSAIHKLTSLNEAAIFAAGPLEDLIARHGAAVIDRVEEQARRSPRFRLVLTGVWAQENEHTEEWKRVEQLQQVRPHIDTSLALPEF